MLTLARVVEKESSGSRHSVAVEILNSDDFAILPARLSYINVKCQPYCTALADEVGATHHAYLLNSTDRDM